MTDTEAAAKALYKLAWGEAAHWPPHNQATHLRFVEKAKAAIDTLKSLGWLPPADLSTREKEVYDEAYSEGLAETDTWAKQVARRLIAYLEKRGMLSGEEWTADDLMTQLLDEEADKANVIKSLQQQLADLSARDAEVTRKALRMAAKKAKSRIGGITRGCGYLSPMDLETGAYECNMRGDCLCQERDEEAEDIAAAILALSPDTERYVMVPEEPTEEMKLDGALWVAAVLQDAELTFGDVAEAVYRAMIGAKT